MQTRYKKILINHLHRLQGQIKGVERMTEQGKYCIDIITQSLAAQKSLQSFNEKLMENHLTEHAAHQFRHGQSGRAIRELTKIYSLKSKG